MRHHSLICFLAPICFLALVLFPTTTAYAQFVQQGSKLVGSGSVGAANQGYSAALSADGNTAIVGGWVDNNQAGAAWVFTRTGGVWSQQGVKLVGSDAAGNATQGAAVAISADGNTAIVGGYLDNAGAGAAWIFTRTGGAWTQQGPKLVGTGAVGAARQGFSVGLSADGNIAAVGGPLDNNNQGATWVWKRSGSVWTQEGTKLVGNGFVGGPLQGWSVAVSGDGNTVLVGGYADNSNQGAVWVFVLSSGVWTQQGGKLFGAGVAGSNANQGAAVALSGDGDTALVGGWNDGSQVGAAWIFVRNAGVWTQQGPKLVGAGSVGASNQGAAVALSLDGNTAVVGGWADNAVTGAAWIFTRSNNVWSQEGPKLVGSNAATPSRQGTGVGASAHGSTVLLAGYADASNTGATWFFSAPALEDLSGDGAADLVWRHNSGDLTTWFIEDTRVIGGGNIAPVDPSWHIVGTRDFNGDGRTDLLWRNTSGAIALWLMNGTSVAASGGIGSIDPAWQIAGTGDFDGDGRADILWRNTSGEVAIWLMDNTTITGGGGVGSVDVAWQIVGTGDYNGDGKADILWRHTSGAVAIWFMNGAMTLGGASPSVVDPAWQIVGTGDHNADGYADILWRNTASGDVTIWFMSGGSIIGGGSVANVDLSWQLVASADYNGDRRADFVWRNASGDTRIWLINGTQLIGAGQVGVVDPAWQVVPVR